jgi:MutS domain V
VNPIPEYQGRLAERRLVATREQKLFRSIGNARLATGIIGVGMCFFVFGEVLISFWWLGIPLVLFFVLVVIHARVVEQLERANRAVLFYERGLERLEDRWMGKGETGDRFRNPAHLYEDDLDIFGKGSLFELLSTARTRSGEDALARWLLAPATREEAAARQEAVLELRPGLDLREELAVLGEAVRSTMDPEAVSRWGEAPEVPFPNGAPVIALILGAAVLVTFGLYMVQITSRTPFLVALLIELGYAFFLGSRTLQVSSAVSSPARDLALLGKLLERLENEPFRAPLLQRMQAELKASGLVASEEIGRLRRLVARLDWQRNLLFTPIAMAILWGAQVAMAIERWRRRSGPHIRAWIAGVGEFEALFALAGYSYERRGNTFPELRDADGGWFEATGLCHPLMPEAQCVPNDLRLGGELRLLIVSGSNMSGKSTLLRSVGLNTVLAWAGAPVCATRLVLSPLAVGASIRVQDSLQDGRSRFYAEITRLREIVNLAAQPRTVLFLIDELLSGTNSHDRRIGAGAIVRTLIERGAIGMITTHDLALAHIAEDLSGRAANVHFADTFQDGRLHFDYRLSPGVVERSNALDLMRSVGLEV